MASAYMNSIKGNFNPSKGSPGKTVTSGMKGKVVSQTPLDNGYLRGFGKKKKS